jgi:hypothetical protein
MRRTGFAGSGDRSLEGERAMIDPKKRPYSDDPYSEVPCSEGDPGVRRARRVREGAGTLCAEAQADGVPCYEVGRDCETCERAYLSWADSQPDAE